MVTTTTLTDTAAAIELGTIYPKPAALRGGRNLDDLDSSSGADERRRRVGGGVDGGESGEDGDAAAPEHAQGEVERWNYPRNNVPRLAFVFISFMVMGMNDAAIGVGFYSLCGRGFLSFFFLFFFG